MGVAIYAQGYKKDSSYIKGELKSLKWYEADLEQAHAFKMEAAFAVLHNDLDSHRVVLAMKNHYSLGIYELGEVSFFLNFSNNVTGWGCYSEGGENRSLMFDATAVLSVINRIIDGFDAIEDKVKNPDEELSELKDLKEQLEKVAQIDGLIEFSVG